MPIKPKNKESTILEELEVFKETTEFKTYTTQLNKDLTKKDREVQQKKSKKYIRDINDFRNGQVFKWQNQVEKTDTSSTYSTPEKTERVYQQQTNVTPRESPQRRGYYDPREGNGGITPRQQYQDGRYGNQYPYTPQGSDRRPQHNERTPQNGGRKQPYWKNNRKGQNGNNWYKPPYDQRDYRGPIHDHREQRRPYDYRNNRGPGYDHYGPRGRSPRQDHDYGERRGPQQRDYYHQVRSPIPTYN